MVGERLGDGAVLGIMLHDVIGMTGGIIFALLVLKIDALALTTINRGILLGVVAGAITIPLGCIPLAIWLGESILIVVAFSLVPHLVWGTVLGVTVAYGLARSSTQS
jgi:hypothetical protein